MWHNDVSYMNVQKFCPHSPRRPFAVLLFRPLRGRGVGFLSLLGLWGALGTCHICCIRRGQSSLGVSALLLCRRGFDARAAWFSNGISFCLLHSVIFVDLSNMTIFWEIWILAITWMKQMLPFRFVWVLRTIWNLYGFICATLYNPCTESFTFFEEKGQNSLMTIILASNPKSKLFLQEIPK